MAAFRRSGVFGGSPNVHSVSRNRDRTGAIDLTLSRAILAGDSQEDSMKAINSVIASLVAAGLVAAPVAAQATPARTSSAVSESEQLAGTSALLYLALAAAAAAIILLVLDEDSFDDVDDLPASP